MEAIETGILSGRCEDPETVTAEPAKKNICHRRNPRHISLSDNQSRRLADRRGTVLQSNWVAIAHFPLVFAVIEQALASRREWSVLCPDEKPRSVLIALFLTAWLVVWRLTMH